MEHETSSAEDEPPDDHPTWIVRDDNNDDCDNESKKRKINREVAGFNPPSAVVVFVSLLFLAAIVAIVLPLSFPDVFLTGVAPSTPGVDDSWTTSESSTRLLRGRENEIIAKSAEDVSDEKHWNSDMNFEILPNFSRNSGCDATCCSILYPPPRHLATNTTCTPPSSSSSVASSLPAFIQYILIILLLSLSALFSGLTLGLMSLNPTELEIVIDGGSPSAATAASKIYPVRSDGNLLLCTLLLGNVAVNAMLSILTADLFGGLVGFLGSTAGIVVFGEIIPQAACSRYALEIGSRVLPLVKVIMVIMWPVARPLAFCLDKVLGGEIGGVYTKKEMMKLLEIQVKRGGFTEEIGTAMTGALKYQDVTVKEVMTSLENTFMLNVDEKLSFDTIAMVFKTGYSRIPVYEVSKNNVIGLLFVKDLIFVDPEDETPLRNFVQIFGRGVHVVWPDDHLGNILRLLKQGHSHMALVRDVNNIDENQDPFYEIKGIITLEDIIEVILGEEIVDETDAFVDVQHLIKVDREAGFDWASLGLLDSKIVLQSLSLEEVKAVTAHLRRNYQEAVELLSDTQLEKMVKETHVTELDTAEQEVGMELPEDLMYKKGEACGVCTLILGGKVTVLAGEEGFRSDVSSWAVLGSRALTDSTYQPDFTAFVLSGPCRCLRFTRERFLAAVDATALERRAEQLGESPKASPEEHCSSNALSLPPSVDPSRMTPANGSRSQENLANPTKRSRRSKMLAAFMHRNGIELGGKTEEEKQSQDDTKGSRAPINPKMEGAETDDEPSDAIATTNTNGAGLQKINSVNDLQDKLSGGGSYIPKPNKIIQSSTNDEKKRIRQSSGALQLLEFETTKILDSGNDVDNSGKDKQTDNEDRNSETEKEG